MHLRVVTKSFAVRGVRWATVRALAAAPRSTSASPAGITAITSGSFSGYALGHDGTVWAWGLNSDGELGNGTTTTMSALPVQVMGLTGVTALSADSYNGYALHGDGMTVASNVPVLVNGLSGAVSVGSGPGSYTVFAVL